MDSSAKAELIRNGNAAFNEGDYPKARKLFLKAGYKSGLVRMGDYYMYDRRLPLLAYGYYKQADAKDKIADIQRRMVGAISQWLGPDKLKKESLQKFSQSTGSFSAQKTDADGLITVPVNGLLRELAANISKKK